MTVIVFPTELVTIRSTVESPSTSATTTAVGFVPTDKLEFESFGKK